MRYPNVYGVDMPTAKEFVAYNLSEEQICEVLGADGLVYQSQQDLLDVGRELNPDIVEFEASCFTGACCFVLANALAFILTTTGCYVHPEINEDYLRALEKEGRGSARTGVSKQLLNSPSMKTSVS